VLSGGNNIDKKKSKRETLNDMTTESPLIDLKLPDQVTVKGVIYELQKSGKDLRLVSEDVTYEYTHGLQAIYNEAEENCRKELHGADYRMIREAAQEYNSPEIIEEILEQEFHNFISLN